MPAATNAASGACISKPSSRQSRTDFQSVPHPQDGFSIRLQNRLDGLKIHPPDKKQVNRTGGCAVDRGEVAANCRWRVHSLADSSSRPKRGRQLVAPGQPEHEDLSLPRIQTAGLQRAISKAPGDNRGRIGRKFDRQAAEPRALKRRWLSNHVFVKSRLTCGKVRVRCLRTNA